MSNTQANPVQTLQPLPPVSEEQNLLTPEASGSCCGGGACSM
ncbi:hypothetical protein [Microbacterium sp. P01]